MKICEPSSRFIEERKINGIYGEISLSLPGGWSYELCPMDSELYGMYGIKLYPDDADDGYIEISYAGSFGVCGMGLVEESATVAGKPAYIGTFDNHEYWDFVAFDREYDGVVALTRSVDEWWSEYGNQVLDILVGSSDKYMIYAHFILN